MSDLLLGASSYTQLRSPRGDFPEGCLPVELDGPSGALAYHLLSERAGQTQSIQRPRKETTMRARATVLILTLLLGAALPAAAALDQAPVQVASLQDQPGGSPDIQVDLNADTGGTVWYTNPLWIALGVVGALVLILIIVLAARGGRGGGTTVIREERRP